jgi:Ca2+-binding RTX toxin-like protein
MASGGNLVTIPAVILGGSGKNILDVSGSSAANILVGGAGKNSLTGGSGKDILIGGGGPAVLTAGSGDDLLISGSTTYDADVAALLSLLAQWSQAADYPSGVHALFNDLLGPVNVLPSVAVNRLVGTSGNGQDWFWLKPGDVLNNLAGGEVATLE